jgi:hypothetical protein
MNYHGVTEYSVTLFYFINKKQKNMNIIWIILFLLLCISTYVIINLLRKNEKLEDNVFTYEKYLESLNSFISDSNKKIKKLDDKGIFEADDEVGYFLKMLKNIQEQLNNFRTDGNKN